MRTEEAKSSRSAPKTWARRHTISTIESTSERFASNSSAAFIGIAGIAEGHLTPQAFFFLGERKKALRPQSLGQARAEPLTKKQRVVGAPEDRSTRAHLRTQRALLER